MERKALLLAASLVFVIYVSGCIAGLEQVPEETTSVSCQSPKKVINGVCCFDDNNNGVCDMEDVGCPDTCDDNNSCTNDTCSASTDFKCVHEDIAPCCGNGVCEKSEDLANECPEDCTVLDISDFQLSNEKAYMDGDKFQFIHTYSSDPMKYFYLNITADKEVIEDIRYTFQCNSTQYSNIDSINSEAIELTDEQDQKVNQYDDGNYLINSNFQMAASGAYSREVEQLLIGETAYFNFKIEKQDPQKRDDLTCLVSFYFIKPQKVVEKWLKISYI